MTTLLARPLLDSDREFRQLEVSSSVTELSGCDSDLRYCRNVKEIKKGNFLDVSHIWIKANDCME